LNQDLNPVTLRQQFPFKYVDAIETLDATRRTATVRVLLNSADNRFSFSPPDSLSGLLLIEAMAQACGALLRGITIGEEGGMLVGVEEAQIPDQVTYPASLLLHVQMISAVIPFFTFHAQVMESSITPPIFLAKATLQVMSKRQFN
jgi:3-hydroxymyristoyl/3-hydroxydecanoyl-(acyl carrier protein) dehydratase